MSEDCQQLFSPQAKAHLFPTSEQRTLKMQVPGSFMADLNQIRAQLREVVAGNLSLDSFDDWFVAHSWNVHQDPSQDVVKMVMVGEIDLDLAEFDRGHLSEAKLIERFRSLGLT